MKTTHILIIASLIAAIVVSFVVIKKILRKKLIDAVTSKYGAIPGIEQKTNEQLKQMLASGEDTL